MQLFCMYLLLSYIIIQGVEQISRYHFQEFPGDILTKIKYTLQFFEAVSKLNKEACGDRPHLMPITRSIGELADTEITNLSIN